MLLLLKRGETVFLEFSVATGTCYLTSHRLITVQHEKGKLETGTRKDYPMKDFVAASANNQTITVHFTGHRQTKLQPALSTPSILQEIKEYLEQTAKLWRQNVP